MKDITTQPTGAAPSARKLELLDAAYAYLLRNGWSGLSLRPLAAAIGSSPRVLLYLFDSKDGLIRALLDRARADELALLERIDPHADGGLTEATGRIWTWLSDPTHRAVLALWAEAYARSLIDTDGPWTGFAESTVNDWLALLAQAQPARERRTAAGRNRRTLALAVLRGALLDLLATGDRTRVTRAVELQLEMMDR